MVLTAEGFTLGLAVGEGVFETTGSVSSGDAAGVDSSTIGLDVGDGVGENVGASIDLDSLWFGVQRTSKNAERTESKRKITRVFLYLDLTSSPYIRLDT